MPPKTLLPSYFRREKAAVQIVVHIRALALFKVRKSSLLENLQKAFFNSLLSSQTASCRSLALFESHQLLPVSYQFLF